MEEMLYISEVGLASADGKRIRKEILPRNKQYRWPNRPGMMLSLTDEVLDTIIKNFKSGTIDVVPFFKVNDKNQHVEDPENSRGTIVDLVKTDKGLDAIIEPVSEEVGRQILATKLGASAGIKFDYADHETGANMGAVLRHVAWTPEPWIPGMDPFVDVSLSGEVYEAVFLSEGGTEDDDRSDEGGENSMDPKEVKAMLSAAIEEALAPITTELAETKESLGKANEQIVSLSTSLNERHSTATAESVKAELDALVVAGLPPAIADLAAPILLEGDSEVHLSSGDVKSVGAQVREMLNLIPKVSFAELGESGVPDGAVVVLSAEQVKTLGFKTEEDDGDDKATLSADEAAIKSVTDLIPAEKRKEA